MRARLTTSRDPATAARLYEAAVEKFTVACEVRGHRGSKDMVILATSISDVPGIR